MSNQQPPKNPLADVIQTRLMQAKEQALRDKLKTAIVSQLRDGKVHLSLVLKRAFDNQVCNDITVMIASDIIIAAAMDVLIRACADSEEAEKSIREKLIFELVEVNKDIRIKLGVKCPGCGAKEGEPHEEGCSFLELTKEVVPPEQENKDG